METNEIICAWCPDNKEKTGEAISKGNTVSHTICPECLEIQEKTVERLRKIIKFNKTS